MEIEKKNVELKKLSEDIYKKQQELKKLETDSNGIKMHLEELRRRRSDNEQRLVRTQEELKKLIEKDKKPKSSF